jgi:hypothetical protein
MLTCVMLIKLGSIFINPCNISYLKEIRGDRCAIVGNTRYPYPKVDMSCREVRSTIYHYVGVAK